MGSGNRFLSDFHALGLRSIIEIKLGAFMAEHSLTISLVESFVKLLKSLFSNDKPCACEIRKAKRNKHNLPSAWL